MTTITFVRHGEAEHNLILSTHIGGRSMNSALTELGHDQASDLAKRFDEQGVTFDALYYSPAIRTAETMQYLARASGLRHLTPIADERLLEMGFGPYEGRLRSEVYTPEIVEEMTRQGIHGTLPGAESIADVHDRMLAFTRDAHTQLPDGNILVVGHGLAIRSLLGVLHNLSREEILSLETANCSLSTMTINSDDLQVTMIGNTPIEPLH